MRRFIFLILLFLISFGLTFFGSMFLDKNSAVLVARYLPLVIVCVAGCIFAYTFYSTMKFQQAIKFIQANKNQEAIDFYKTNEKKWPKAQRYLIYSNIGTAYYNLKNYDEAIKYYDLSLELKPKFALAYQNKGAAFIKLKRYKEASDCFEYALKHLGVMQKLYKWIIFINLAELKFRLGEIDAAIEYAHNTLKLNPKAAGAYDVLGQISQSLGKTDEALSNYKKAQELFQQQKNLIGLEEVTKRLEDL